MSQEIEILLPKLGESILSATVVQWFKKVGDTVKEDEPLLEVSTDKVNSEIPSPQAGTITAILVDPDEEVDVGTPLARMSGELKKELNEKALPEKVASTARINEGLKRDKHFFTPVVLKLARHRGISLHELEAIPGTGAGGRLSRRDLEKYIEKRAEKVEFGSKEGDEILPMSPMRRAIASSLVRSFYTAPPATLVMPVDLTHILALVKREKATFEEKEGCKLTITSVLAYALAHSVAQYPLINASLSGETIIKKGDVNLGIAVSVDDGVLVPVIRQCNQRSIRSIAIEIAQLVRASKGGTLKPHQTEKGTLTLTNFGMSGIMMGTPILREGEVAIVGVGAIEKRVVVEDGDAIKIRDIMHLSLTFDHRAFDGMYACGFLSAIKESIRSINAID